MSKNNSPKRKFQQTTDIKTAKMKNRNEFSFADSSKSINGERQSLARNLYEPEDRKKPKESVESSRKMLGQKKYISTYLSDSSIFKENIDNRQRIQNLYSKINSSGINHEEMEALKNDHRIEVEKLLLEISRLHDVIYELELTKKTEIGRLKEEYEHLAYLSINNMKQSQESQILIFENQIKTVKNALEFKQAQNQELQKVIQRERNIYKSQIETLQEDLKNLVQKKNNQMFKVQEANEINIEKINQKNQVELEEAREICDRELKKLYKQVQDKEKTLQKLSEKSIEYEKRNEKLMDEIQLEKEAIEQKMKEIINRNNAKYDSLQRHINQMMEQSEEKQAEQLKLSESVYQAQISNLMLIIKAKNQEIQKLHVYLQTSASTHKIIQQNTESELNEFKSLLQREKQNHLREIEELKVKMAILHENDIKQLVKLYEAKIQSFSNQILSLENENGRIHKFMHEESHRWYENKKKYEIRISKLMNQISNMKAGFGDLQKSMAEKLENERSALLITSQNLIRDAEIKNSNVKFYEDELRKLRATMESEAANHERIQKQMRLAYITLQDQNKDLVNRNKQLIAEHDQMQSEFYECLNEKEGEIRKLNKITHDLLEKDEESQNAEILSLQATITKLQEKIGEKETQLKEQVSKIYGLERKLAEYNTENEQLLLETQISQEQSKADYDKMMGENVQSIKKFYEKKIQELESDKTDLIARNSAQAENVAQLIRRYNELEQNMSMMIEQGKKRSVLEQKILHLGLDGNLVANKASLFKRREEI